MKTVGKNLVITPRNAVRYGGSERRPGLWAGIVEYNIDPAKRGRCKVRIPSLDSTESSIPTKKLPWALPLHHVVGAHDSGGYSIPPVGSTVYVMFLHEDPDYPVWLGGWSKSPGHEHEHLTKTDAETGEMLPPDNISMGQWMSPPGPEVPREALSSPVEPTVQIQKTVKGHSIYSDDRDGFEHLTVVDRAGQLLRFSGPITDGDNRSNGQQRGIREASRGEAVEYGRLAGGIATVELCGVNGQGIRIESREGEETIEIMSGDGTPGQEPNRNKWKITLGGASGELRLSGIVDGSEMVNLSIDLLSTIIRLNAPEMRLDIDVKEMNIRSETVQITGDLKVGGDLTVSGLSYQSGDGL